MFTSKRATHRRWQLTSYGWEGSCWWVAGGRHSLQAGYISLLPSRLALSGKRREGGWEELGGGGGRGVRVRGGRRERKEDNKYLGLVVIHATKMRKINPMALWGCVCVLNQEADRRAGGRAVGGWVFWCAACSHACRQLQTGAVLCMRELCGCVHACAHATT